MPEPRSFAYSLSQFEDGWAWRVYDENGVLVAKGADQSQDGAKAAVDRTLKRGSPLEGASEAA